MAERSTNSSNESDGGDQEDVDIDRRTAQILAALRDPEVEKARAEAHAARMEKLQLTKPGIFALMDAVEHGAQYAVEYLLKAGVYSGYFNDWRGTTSTFVTENDHTEILHGNPGLNPLLKAACLGNVEIVRLLLEHGSNYTWDDYVYWVALDLASYEYFSDWDDSVVKVQVEGWITTLGWDLLYSLLSAMEQGHAHTIEAILKNNASRIYREWSFKLEYTYGEKEFFSLAERGDAHAVETFLQAGFPHCQHALELAAQYGRIETVEVFMKAGLEMESINSAFVVACDHGRLQIARLLLTSSKVQVNIASGIHYFGFFLGTYIEGVRSTSALCKAVYSGYINITKLLLLHDVNVGGERFKEDATKTGYSALDVLLYDTFTQLYTYIRRHEEKIVRHGYLLCAAGARIHQEILSINSMREFLPRFVIENENPDVSSLKSLCRQVIRESMLSPTQGNQNNLLTGIPQLPLPTLLKKYLVYYNDIPDQNDAEFLGAAVSRATDMIPRALSGSQAVPPAAPMSPAAPASLSPSASISPAGPMSPAPSVSPAAPLYPAGPLLPAAPVSPSSSCNPYMPQQLQNQNVMPPMLTVPPAPYIQLPPLPLYFPRLPNSRQLSNPQQLVYSAHPAHLPRQLPYTQQGQQFTFPPQTWNRTHFPNTSQFPNPPHPLYGQPVVYPPIFLPPQQMTYPPHRSYPQLTPSWNGTD